MKNWLKKILLKFPKLGNYVYYFNGLFQALKLIHINLDSLCEYNSLKNGYVSLSPGNRKFYTNVLKGLNNLYTEELSDLIILDIGANDGWFAKVVYRILGKDSLVISFEPLISMLPDLKLIADKFKNYKYENIGLGDSKKINNITEYKTSGLSSFKKISDQHKYNKQNLNTDLVSNYPVNIITLDEYLKNSNITNPLILKIDVQGFEYEVLQGIEWSNRPKFIYLEDDLGNGQKISTFLAQKGYLYLCGSGDKVFVYVGLNGL